MHGGKGPVTRVGVIRLALRMNRWSAVHTQPDWIALCHYSRPTVICKYPKATIFVRKIRDNIHKEKFSSDFTVEICDNCWFCKNCREVAEKTLKKGLTRRWGCGIILAQRSRTFRVLTLPPRSVLGWYVLALRLVLCRAECSFARFFITRVHPGIGGNFLLALQMQKKCTNYVKIIK